MRWCTRHIQSQKSVHCSSARFRHVWLLFVMIWLNILSGIYFGMSSQVTELEVFFRRKVSWNRGHWGLEMRKISIFLVVRAADESTRVNSYTWTKKWDADAFEALWLVGWHICGMRILIIFLKWFGDGLYMMLYDVIYCHITYNYIYYIIYIIISYNILFVVVSSCELATRPFSSILEYEFPSSEAGYVSPLGCNWRRFHNSMLPCLDLMYFDVIHLIWNRSSCRQTFYFECCFIFPTCLSWLCIFMRTFELCSALIINYVGLTIKYCSI